MGVVWGVAIKAPCPSAAISGRVQSVELQLVYIWELGPVAINTVFIEVLYTMVMTQADEMLD